MQMVKVLIDITLDYRYMMKSRQNLVLFAVTEGTPWKTKEILMNLSTVGPQVSSGLAFDFGGLRGRTSPR